MENDAPEEERKRNPFIYILAVLIILLMVIFLIPVGSIKWIPKPKNIPTIDQVLENAPVTQESLKLNDLNEANKIEITPFLKHAGSMIARSCNTVSDNCYAEAMYVFVRDNIDYVKDPKKEYIETPKAVLLSKSADCDGQAVLLYALLKSVGVDARIAITSNHAFVQTYLPTKVYFYKPARKLVSLDPTCRTCDFGEIPSEYLEDIIGYVG